MSREKEWRRQKRKEEKKEKKINKVIDSKREDNEIVTGNKNARWK